jgi:hypothetical protein
VTNLADDLRSNQRWLDSQWTLTRAVWRDQSAVHFEHDHWARLESEATEIALAADELLRVLERAAPFKS